MFTPLLPAWLCFQPVHICCEQSIPASNDDAFYIQGGRRITPFDMPVVHGVGRSALTSPADDILFAPGHKLQRGSALFSCTLLSETGCQML
jgi:hypothetical protein